MSTGVITYLLAGADGRLILIVVRLETGGAAPSTITATDDAAANGVKHPPCRLNVEFLGMIPVAQTVRNFHAFRVSFWNYFVLIILGLLMWRCWSIDRSIDYLTGIENFVDSSTRNHLMDLLRSFCLFQVPFFVKYPHLSSFQCCFSRWRLLVMDSSILERAQDPAPTSSNSAPKASVKRLEVITMWFRYTNNLSIICFYLEDFVELFLFQLNQSINRQWFLIWSITFFLLASASLSFQTFPALGAILELHVVKNAEGQGLHQSYLWASTADTFGQSLTIVRSGINLQDPMDIPLAGMQKAWRVVLPNDASLSFILSDFHTTRLATMTGDGLTEMAATGKLRKNARTFLFSQVSPTVCLQVISSG